MMNGRRRPGWRSRPTAALLTLAAHAAFVLLLLIEARNTPPPPPLVRQPVMIPITLPPLVEPPQRPSDSTESSGEEARPRAPRTVTPVVTVAPAPSTAITLPAPGEEQGAPADRDVDWYAQAAERARVYAAEVEAPPESFSPPPVVLRKPCKPAEDSFEFKQEQPSTGGSAMLTPGWEKPDPNKHLFDDMMAGRRLPSSVPDPNTCD